MCEEKPEENYASSDSVEQEGEYGEDDDANKIYDDDIEPDDYEVG